jgi:hypothetical protein
MDERRLSPFRTRDNERVNWGGRDIAVVGGIVFWAAVVLFALSQLLDFEASTRTNAMLAVLALVGAGTVVYGLTRR